MVVHARGHYSIAHIDRLYREGVSVCWESIWLCTDGALLYATVQADNAVTGAFDNFRLEILLDEPDIGIGSSFYHVHVVPDAHGRRMQYAGCMFCGFLTKQLAGVDKLYAQCQKEDRH